MGNKFDSRPARSTQDNSFDREVRRAFGAPNKASFKNEQMNNPDKILYSSDSFSEYLLENFLNTNIEAGYSILRYVDQEIWVKKDKLQSMMEELCSTFEMIVSQNYRGICLISRLIFIELDWNDNAVNHIKIYSINPALAEKIMKVVETFRCNDQKISLHWIYSEDGRAVELIEECDETVNASHYPFIKDFDTYIERFIESKSNILILQGPPGTGKTSLIRQMLMAMDKEAYLTYDSRILENDFSFAQYMSDDNAGAFIIEDADLFLRSRADGNSMVSRFLNIGDGLIRMKKKKLIFSTNLPNLNDIDPALIRPGRCFDIVHFRELTRNEAQVIATARNLTLVEGKQNFTLAEVFNSPLASSIRKVSFGFA